MPIEEINPYTPQLYRSLGTPVTVDLSLGESATDIAETLKQVQALPQAISNAIAPTNAGITQLGTDMSAKVDGAETRLVLAQAQALNAAVETVKSHANEGINKVLEAFGKLSLPAPAPAPAPAPITVSAKAAPLLSLLTQVQTLALDAKPGEPYKGKEPEFKGWIGENVTMHGLREAARKEFTVLTAAAPPLPERFAHAFDEFTANDLGSRSKRFAEVHVLIADIATFLA